MLPEFVPFQKISRLSRDVTITEKLDGTNAVVYVGEDYSILAGSRNRWLTPEDDNFGFAAWVEKNSDDLRDLGPGRHFGEWWGIGIGRNYGLRERKFSLFNTKRWIDNKLKPQCCDIVPIICTGVFDSRMVDFAIEALRVGGSFAAPKFMKPEGIVIYHTHSNTLFKRTLENDEMPKGQVAA